MSESPQAEAPARPTRTKRRGSRVVRMALIVVTSAVLLEALVGEKGFLATIRARREYDRLAGEIARTRAENARLRDAARRLREDPAAIEELARRELGLLKLGETLFIIKDVPPGDVTPSQPSRPK